MILAILPVLIKFPTHTPHLTNCTIRHSLPAAEAQILRHVLLVEIINSSEEIIKRRNVESSLHILEDLTGSNSTPMSAIVGEYRTTLFNILTQLDGDVVKHVAGNTNMYIGDNSLSSDMVSAIKHALIRCSADLSALNKLPGMPHSPPAYRRDILKRILEFFNKAV